MALTGVVLPLLLIGDSKFAAFEVEALKPLIGGTPWLAWMYAVSSPVGVSRVLGVIEIATPDGSGGVIAHHEHRC